MNIEQSISFFCSWLNCLFAATAAAAGAEAVQRRERIPYAGAGHPGLVMDVYAPPPARAKGRALLVVASGGFYSTPAMLDKMAPFLKGLAAGGGYTVFAVTHQSLGQAVISRMIPQVQRAVRTVRHHAHRFGIDPDRIGVMGFSSGGFMALSAGVRGDDGLADAADPVDRASSRVQAVVAFFPPTDFLNFGEPGAMNLGVDLMSPFAHAFIDRRANPAPEDMRALARVISPRYHVSAQAAPTLLIHGAVDRLVPPQQSRIFLEAMKQAGAECQLRIKEGAGHGWSNMKPDLAAAGRWLDRHLAAEPGGKGKPRERIAATVR